MNDDILESSVKVIEYIASEVSAEKQLMYKFKLPYVKTFFLPGILAVSWVFQNLHGFSQSAKSRRKKKLSISQSFHKTTAKCAPSLALFPGFRRHAVFMQQNIYSRVYWARQRSENVFVQFLRYPIHRSVHQKSEIFLLIFSLKHSLDNIQQATFYNRLCSPM